MKNKDRKFLIVGNENTQGTGIGNILIFYPAAYYFSVFTSREIIIEDNSIIGEMCNIITCGFPFVSDLVKAFPDILTKSAINDAPNLKAWDFQRYMESEDELVASVVRASGYMPKSDWWIYFNTTVECVKKVTGCDLGDVPCADRHAYQRLVRGPFRSSLTSREEERIDGIPDHIKHAILTLPHSYAPRLDVAVHLRCQFHHFEQSSDINNPEYKKEVTDWLNSTEASEVFNAIEAKLIEVIESSKLSQMTSISTTLDQQKQTEIEILNNKTKAEEVYVYLASDNEDVKDTFGYMIGNQSYEYNIKVMKVETKFIHHVKNLEKLKEATNNEGLLDMIFDWYALSLSNVILAWRKGGTGLVSTFVQSAQHVSGTIDRTNIDSPLGAGGMGTKGYQLVRHKRGYLKWDAMWIYGFAEDYQVNGH